jgi:hypothetical protein
LSAVGTAANVSADFPNLKYIPSTGTLFANVISLVGNVEGGNIRTAGAMSATGNITGNYILGNGSQLSGISITPSSISNGTANVRTFLNGNVSISAAGTANVMIVTTSGANISGTMFATQLEATSGTGRVSLQTDAGGAISIGRVDGAAASTPYIDFNSSYTPVDYDVRVMASGNASTTGGGTLTITAATLAASAVLSAVGNIQGGNLLTAGLISATGNVSGSNVIASGNLYYSGNILVARSLQVGTRTTVATIPLGAGGNVIVLTRTGNANVIVTT